MIIPVIDEDRPLQQAIERTKKYYRSYGTTLSARQISQRLLGKEVFDQKKVEDYCLAKYGMTTKKIHIIYEEKIKKASEVGRQIGRLPWILMVGVTGSVATEDPKDKDDIDLMIICQNQTMWLTRLVVWGWMVMKGIPHRTYGKNEKKDQFCLNLWLEIGSLLIPKNRVNQRNAIDLLLLKPIINRQKTYERFLEINTWAKKYVATGLAEKIGQVDRRQSEKTKEVRLRTKMVNRVCFWLQRLYMRGKIGHGQVTIATAFFYP